MIEQTKLKTEEELARLRQERRKNRKMAQQKAFHLNITPEHYRGMKFLGNFKPKEHNNSLNDPRLANLHHDLFLNKTVLDVGTGDGSVAIQIAIRMLPERIVALDIDADMLALCKRRVDKLIANSEKYTAISRNEEIQKTLSEFPIYFQELAKKAQNKNIIKAERFLEVLPEGLTVKQEFPHNLFMLNDNFFNMEAKPIYDTVICLGTVKWVHLAFGDDGLQAFFQKMHDFLKPGGHLVLEYSHYSSYRQKKGLYNLFKQNFKDKMKIDPLTFPSLLKFLGFQLVNEVQSTQERPLKHPLQIFMKTESPESM